MKDGMKYLLENIQGAKLGYQQSDEISILITDFDTLTTDAWFDYNIQKICSISASMLSARVNSEWDFDLQYTDDFGFGDKKIGLGWKFSSDKLWLFDARCFNIPKEEVNNYFIWRQKDWERNSLQMLCRANFSHKELHGKKRPDMHEMLYSIGVNWSDLDAKWKNGVTIFRNEKGMFEEDNGNIFLDSKICDSLI